MTLRYFGVDPDAVPEFVRDMGDTQLSDAVIVPALINAHDHLHLNTVPPLPHSVYFRSSYEWIKAFQPHFDSPQVKDALAVSKEERLWHGGLKNLLCGTTTVMHHDLWHAALEVPSFPVRAQNVYGWSHSLRLSARGQYGPSPKESYTATSPQVPWFIHLAEGTDDDASAELGALDAMGCLGANTVLIHGVGLSDGDIDRIIACGAHVVWCPTSNLGMLGQTIHPQRIRKLFDAGLLAIGTDSRLTGARDLLDELRCAQRQSDLTPAELFLLATVCNQNTLRLNAARQDFIILNATHNQPAQAVLHARRSDIRATIRAGKPWVTDVDLAAWFDVCSVEAQAILLDGKPKLIAQSAMLGLGAATEPGLDIREVVAA